MNTPDNTLMIRYFDGELTDADILVLREQLRGDPRALDAFITLARREAMLVELIRSEHAATETTQEGEGSPTLWKPAPRSRSWSISFAAAAGLMIAVGLWWWGGVSGKREAVSGGGEILARVVEVHGDARVACKEGPDLVVAAGRLLRVGDRLEVPKNGRLVFAYSKEATTMTAGSEKRETRVSLGYDRNGKRLQLDQGSLEARVAPQPQGQVFVATTPHAKAELFGTRFSLSVTAKRSRVVVDEGRVAVARHTGTQRVVVDAGKYCDIGFVPVGADPAAAGLFVLPKEDLSWRSGRVLWSTDFESETANREWVAFSIENRSPSEGHEAKRFDEPGKFLQFKRMHRGGGDSTVMVMDGSGLKSPISMGIVHPRAQEIMKSSSYVLEYDLGESRTGASEPGNANEAVWQHVEVSMAKTAAGFARKIRSNGCLVSAGITNPRHDEWFSLFVFSYLRKEQMVDNLSFRELTRGGFEADLDE